MRRSFVLAFVLVVLAPRLAAAQSAPKPIEIPVQISNAAAGTVVEFFLNDGKKGEVLIDISGTSGFVLDMANSGKTKLTLYVDVCKDGQIVKVIFAAGEPPPKDENCNRKIVAAGFYNDCGITRVTIDIAKMLGKVAGCGGILNTKTLIAVGGGVAGAVALTAGGGGSSTAPTATSPPPAVAANSPTTTPPPTSTAPPSTTPSNPAPPAATPTEFTVTIMPTYSHVTSNESLVCGVVVSNPPQPGAQFTVTGSGIGLLPGQAATGTLNASGRGTFQLRIILLGTYGLNATVVSNSVTRTATGSVNVTAANNTCPSS